MQTRAKLLVFILARDQASARQLWNTLQYGLSPVCDLTSIFVLCMRQCYRASGIEQWEKRQVKRATLSDLTIQH